MSSFKRKMQRQIQKNNGTLLHKKVVARKMGCKSVEEYNRRMARREKNLKEMEDNKDGKGWKDLYPLKNYGRQGKPTAISKKFSGNTLKDAEGKDIVFK